MDGLEGLLLNHRRVLMDFMEDWSRQQEDILSKYACGLQPPRHEAAGHAVDPPVPTAADSGGAVVELMLSDDPFADGTKPDTNSVDHTIEGVEPTPFPLVQNETEAIRVVVPTELFKSKSEISLSLPAPGNKGCLQKFVESGEFSIAISVVILCNVLFMAITADHMLDAAQSGRRSTEMYLPVGEVVFTSIYIIELALKLICSGKGFLCGSEWKWNVFDLIVVFSALVDLIPPSVIGETINMSYLRVNRPLKLLKMLRIVKVYRSFKQLRLIIASILGCVKTMLWAFALLTIVIFTFSLIFVQAVTDYARAKHPDDWNPHIMQYWGSTTKAMNTLFQASTGGEDWAKTADPLWDLGWTFYGAFLMYICFFMFVVVNVLTAVFVDAAIDSSIKDDSLLIEDEIRHRMDYIRQLEVLYHRLDNDGSGELSWAKFHKGLHSPEMVAFASTLDIEISDIHEFFRLISFDGRDGVDIESFVVGCMKLKGPAKNLDVVSLLHRTKHIEHVTAALSKKTDSHLHEIQRLLSRVLHEQGQIKGAANSQLSRADLGSPVSGGLASGPHSATDGDTFSRDISI